MASLQSFLFILVTLTLAMTLSSLQAQPHNQLFSKVTHTTIPTDQQSFTTNQNDPTIFNPESTSQTESGDPFDKYPRVIYNPNNDNHYNNIDDLRLSERDGYAHATRNGMNQFYNNRNRYGNGNRRPRRHHVNNNYNNYLNMQQQYNGEQQGPQGMSDTRFVENGKYYYDLDRESEDPNGYQNWRAVALSNTQYDTFHNQNQQLSGFQETYNDDDQYVP